jgi:dTDP-4-amino-4,6-dideoxygalactose transaminase
VSKIPFIKPKFPSADDISSDYEAIVESNWFTNFGPYERELCRQVAAFLDHDVHVATTANATLALDLASRLLFKKGTKKQILVPSFTFVAGPAVLIDHGLTPVFIDIDESSLQPNIDQAKDYILSHIEEVGGILLCNIFGVGNQGIGQWEEMATEFGLPLVIDSAAGFGSRYTQDEYIGGRGDCEIFSLHATKPFSVGEGGLLVSKDATFIDKVRSLENFGFDSDRNITAIGTNAKLQELNCAIGIRQLAKLSDRLQQRQESLRIYKNLLTPKGYHFQDNDELSTVAFVSAIAPTKEAADKSELLLKSNEIEVKKYYAPLHRYPLVNDAAVSDLDLSNTEDVADRILSLPLHDEMSEETIKRICSYTVG